MTEPSPDRVPTTFMSQRGLKPTTKLIYLGAALAFLGAVFWLGRAYMMMPAEGEEGRAPGATPVQPALPTGLTSGDTASSGSSAASAASATSAEPVTAASAEAADQPIHAAPELTQPKGTGTFREPTGIELIGHAPSAQSPSAGPPSLLSTNIDLSKGATLLEDVRDNTFGVDEAAFYWLVQTVNSLSASYFVPEAPDKQVAIAKLAEFPRTYRGQPVTLSLVVGKCEKFGLPLSHAGGIKGLWVIEGYQTPFVGEAPVCDVILTENPGPVAVQTPILVRGYFYKVRAYDKLHDDGDIWHHQCPLIVAKTIEIIPSATEATGTLDDILNSKNSSLIVGGVIGMAFVLFMIVRRVLAVRAGMPTLQPKRELTPEEIAQRVNYLKHEETAPPSAATDDEDPDPVELARRRDEALAKFEEQSKKPPKK